MPLFKRKSKAEGATEAAQAPEVKKTPAKKETKVKKTEGVLAKSFSKVAVRTTLTPLVTEKNAHHADEGVYVFRVPASANRLEVRETFRELYKVTPVKVHVMRVHGKEHRFGRSVSRESDWKKALVTVPSGTRIDVFTL